MSEMSSQLLSNSGPAPVAAPTIPGSKGVPAKYKLLACSSVNNTMTDHHVKITLALDEPKG